MKKWFRTAMKEYFLLYPVILFCAVFFLSASFFQKIPWLDVAGLVSVFLFCKLRNICVTRWSTAIYIYIYKCIFAAAVFLSLSIFFCYRLTHRQFEMGDLSLICDSGVNEFFEFLLTPEYLLLIFSGILVVLLLGIHELISRRLNRVLPEDLKLSSCSLRLLYVVSALLGCVTLLQGSLIGIRYPRQLLKEYIGGEMRTRCLVRDFAAGRKYAAHFLQQSDCRLSANRKPVVCILIVGESAAAQAMECYGGPVKNTPFLSGRTSAFSGDLVLVRNSYALDNLTTYVYHPMLSNSDHVSNLSVPRSIFLFDICRFLKIPTWMISNQPAKGTSISEIEYSADKTIFPYDNPLKNCALLDKITPPDEIILPALEDVLNQLDSERGALIVLHLFGSHFPFRNRLPEHYQTLLSRNGYTDKEFYYFQTIEYTDRLLAQICRIAESKISMPFFICYVSDHGEDPSGRIYRGSRSLLGNVAAFFEIPCAFMLSRRYSELYPEKLNNLKMNSGKIFINDHIFDSLLDAMGCETSDTAISAPEKSLFSNSYEQKLEGVRALNRSVPLSKLLKL